MHCSATRTTGSSSEFSEDALLLPAVKLCVMELRGEGLVGDGGGVLVMEWLCFSQILSSKPVRCNKVQTSILHTIQI